MCVEGSVQMEVSMCQSLRSSSSMIAFLFVLSVQPTSSHAQATSSVKCSDGTVTVSTGDSSGTCVKSGSVFTCGAGQTNQAGGGCDASGKASCGNTGGAGSCTISLTATGPGTRPPKVKGVRPDAVRGGVLKRQ